MTQTHLFEAHPDFPFKGAGHRRTHMGAIMEEVVCGLLGLTRAKTGGAGVYQPDAHNSTSQPVEIKSVCINSKLKGKSVLYDFRMEKDRIHAPELAYVFACHTSVGKGKAKTMGQFLDRLQDTPLLLAMVPAWIVRIDAHAFCKLCKVKTSQSKGKRAGYQREGYIDGYRNLEVHRYLIDAEEHQPCVLERWGRRFTAEALRYRADPWSRDPRGEEAAPNPPGSPPA